MEDSRIKAIANGDGKYQGTPCKVCGCVYRYTSNYNCVNCNEKNAKAYRLKTAELLRSIKQKRAGA